MVLLATLCSGCDEPVAAHPSLEPAARPAPPARAAGPSTALAAPAQGPAQVSAPGRDLAQPASERAVYPFLVPESETWEDRRHAFWSLESDLSSGSLVPNPTQPIEGDFITVAFRMPSLDELCVAWPEVVSRAADVGEPTVIALRLDPEARPCTQTASFERSGFTHAISRVRLGRLPAGRYRIVAGAQQVELRVSPRSTDPGPLPVDLHVRMAVVLAHQPSTCDSGGLMTVLFDAREDMPTTVRRLARAYPELPEDRRLQILYATQQVDVAPAGDGYDYAFSSSSGDVCTTVIWTGHARVLTRGGRLRVEVGAASPLPQGTYPPFVARPGTK